MQAPPPTTGLNPYLAVYQAGQVVPASAGGGEVQTRQAVTSAEGSGGSRKSDLGNQRPPAQGGRGRTLDISV